ncbi:hypothetical protein FRC18_006515 [Serendipita sp. 400]|nr:hypothetical protein FRC18_006515 [Serendipita sp. 400]
MYELWRETREQISNMLSLLDSINSKSYTESNLPLVSLFCFLTFLFTSDIQTRIDKRVDEGFETIRRKLSDQKRTLKDYFNACRALIASTNSNSNPKGADPPSGPVPPAVCNHQSSGNLTRTSGPY